MKKNNKGFSLAELIVVVLILGILGLIGAVALFVLGRSKNTKLKNYSALGLGIFIVSTLIGGHLWVYI